MQPVQSQSKTRRQWPSKSKRRTGVQKRVRQPFPIDEKRDQATSFAKRTTVHDKSSFRVGGRG